MKGPKPVWTSDTKNMNQSRPRRLAGDGAKLPGSDAQVRPGFLASAGTGDISSRLLPNAPGCPPIAGSSTGKFTSREWDFRWQSIHARSHRTPRSARPLDTGGKSHLIAGEVDGDVVWTAIAGKAQGAPIQGDLAAPNPKKSAKIEDCRARLSVPADNHVNDPSYIFPAAVADALAQNVGHLPSVENDGRSSRVPRQHLHSCRRSWRWLALGRLAVGSGLRLGNLLLVQGAGPAKRQRSRNQDHGAHHE